MGYILTPSRRAALAAACLAVAALPAVVLWNAVRPAPWDSRTVRIRFESVRYETTGLIFTYSVENRAWHSLRLVPDQTQIRLLPVEGLVPAGYASFPPMLLEGHSTGHVELRMNLPADRARFFGRPFADPMGAALPPAGPLAAALAPMDLRRPDDWIEASLRSLAGFELVNPSRGVRLTFPRGW
jgi:hypothetical protein